MGVLLLDGLDHVVGGEIERGHFFGIEPEPHAVIALADVGDVAHAVEPGAFVFELNGGVIAEI